MSAADIADQGPLGMRTGSAGSIPEGTLVMDADVRRTYGVDASVGSAPASDFQVVRARDEADVIEVLRHAAATGTPIVPQGARTGLCGGAVATEGSIVLNVEKLDAIETIDEVEGIAILGPGVVNADLKAAAAQAGLFYPPDPASSATCTVGGNVATNAGGLCCIKYGVTADYIRGLRVVLPGGELLTTGRRTAKGVAGVDLTGCFVGSEGTFGVVTQIIAKLVPAPATPLTALATFGDLETAARAVVALRRIPQRPSMLEFLDALSIAAIQQVGDFGLPGGCAAVLLVQSDRTGHMAEDVSLYGEIMERFGALDVAVAEDAQESDALLLGRRALNTAHETKGHHVKEDICVPVARLADLVAAGLSIGERHGLEIAMAGHGGDGNLHPVIFFDRDDPDQQTHAELAFDELIRIALDLGGTIAGEHGIGTLKAPWLGADIGEAAMVWQRRLKDLFDPRGIMNPGKVLQTTGAVDVPR